MNLRLRWKVVVVSAIVLASSICVFHKGLTLGLDLKGGVQFVLRVNVEENDALGTGAQVTRDEIVAQARYAVDRRINELGVVEPLIAVQGTNRNELLIQLPGFTDVTRARTVLGTTARLDWKLVEAGPEIQRDSLLVNGVEPDGTEILTEQRGTASPEAGAPVRYYRVKRVADVSGRDIRHARTLLDDNNQAIVAFSLTPDGGRRFATLTTANVGRQLAIVLDGRIQSAPVIEDPITGGEGTIRGSFSLAEATDLALVLRSGALPVSMTYLGGQYVGPTLGQRSIQAGSTARSRSPSRR